MFDVVLLTGSAGSGKTTTADAWASSRLGPAAHVSHDAVHQFIRSGLASPADGPSAEAERQWRLAIDVCVAACRIYVEAGVRCTVDTFLLPSSIPLWAGLQGLRVGVIVLRPDVDVAVNRNTTRLRETGWGVPKWQVRANHEAMEAWMGREDVLVVDSTDKDMKQIVAVIDDWESSGRFPSLVWAVEEAE